MKPKKKARWRRTKLILLTSGIIIMVLIGTNALLPQERKFINLPNFLDRITKYLEGDSKYVELLVKTGDNVLSKTNKSLWTQEMLDEERRGNYKQGYIVLAKSEDWTWGNLERDPKRFMILRIPRNVYNESWLEPEYDYDSPIFYEGNETGSYEIKTRRKYKIPLESVLNPTELTNLKEIEYGKSVNWTIEKNVPNIANLIEYNNWSEKPIEWISHGSSGNHTMCIPSGCDYTTIAGFESGEEGSLVGTGPARLNISGTWATNDTTPVTFGEGWTTTSDDYIHVFTDKNSGARHDGKWNNTAYRLEFVTNAGVSGLIGISEHNIILEGLQFNVVAGEDYASAIGSNGYGNLTYKDNIIKRTGSGVYSNGVGIAMQNPPVGSQGNIINNIVYDFVGANKGIGTYNENAFDKIFVYSNTVINSTTAYFTDWKATAYKNNLCFDSPTCFTGNIQTATNNAYVRSSSLPSGLNITGNSSSDIFVDYANRDLHLISTTILVDNGADLSADSDYDFNDDIDGDTRGATWDIGADEYVSGVDSTSPTYSNNQTNTTAAGASVNFSILWNDNSALHPNGQYVFSTNNTGVWVNDSVVNFTMTPQMINITKTLNSTIGTFIGFRWYANDSAGNTNNTILFTLTITSGVDNPPQWFDNSTNSTIAGTLVEHRVRWSDDIALSGYIFSYCNGTYGTAGGGETITSYNFTDLVNNTAFNGTGQNANRHGGTEAVAGVYTNLQADNTAYAVVTSGGNNHEPFWRFNFTINDTVADINWINISINGFESANSETATANVYNFTSNLWSEYTVGTLPSSDGPISSNMTSDFNDFINANSQFVVAVQGDSFDSGESFSIDFIEVIVSATSGGAGVSSCLGATPTFTNESFIEMNGVINWSNITMLINSTVGSTMKWRVYTNDSTNQLNATDIFVYNTTSAVADCWADITGGTYIPSGCSYYIPDSAYIT